MKKNFIAGLVILLPIIITILIIGFFVNILTEPFMNFTLKILKNTNIQIPYYILKYGSQIIILICLFLFTIFLGILMKLFFMKSIVNLSERILNKIPFVNTVYKATQDVIKMLFITDKKSFQDVVLVPFPNDGLFSIGFISREAPETCSKILEKDMVSVLIPATPNPTTGFLVLFNRKELTFLDISPEDAIKYVVSCGVILPPKEIKKM